MKASSDICPRSSPLRVRTATCCGLHLLVAHNQLVRQLLQAMFAYFIGNFLVAQIGLRRAGRPAASVSATCLRHNRPGASEIFITTTCTGASHSGKAPAWFSIRMPMKRSSEPRIARCSITGILRVLSSATYSAPKRPGIEKSTCIVPHCQERPMRVLDVEFDLRAVERALARQLGPLRAGRPAARRAARLRPCPRCRRSRPACPAAAPA